MPIPTQKNPTGAKPAAALPEGGFLQTLQTMRKGCSLADLEANMRELVAHVRRTRKPGSMTWKVKVSPNSKGNVEILAIDDDVSIKLPKTEGGVTIYYADDDGRLLRNDPRQMEHPALVELPQEPAQPVKQVSAT
jgi:hypothetical protein